MLSVANVHTFYGESHVLHGVSLELARGTIAAVLGRNGMGKTTLCRSIVGFTPARVGRIVFNGADIARLPPHQIAARGIGLVPQGRRVFPSLSVQENLAIAARARPVQQPWTLARVDELFPRLAERRHHKGNELSGGEQQMLAIARALLANPTLLVMDEPTEGLAPSLVAAVGDLIQRLKQEEMAILLVEQNAAFAVKIADRIHVMSKGAIVYASDPATLWANEEVKTQYLGVSVATK